MRGYFSAILVLLAAGSAWAQLPFSLPRSGGTPANSIADIADIKATIEPAAAKPGEVVTFKLTVAPKPGAKTYPVNPPTGQNSVNGIAPPSKSGPLIFVGPAPADPPGWKEALEEGQLQRYYTKPATWEMKAVVSPTATPGEQPVPLTGVKILACTFTGQCFYSHLRTPPTADLKVLPGPAVAVPKAYQARVTEVLAQSGPNKSPGAVPPDAAPAPRPPSGGIQPKEAVSPGQYEAELNDLGGKIDRTPVAVQGGFAGLLLAAAFWGFVSLVTPCVFPMIPITVSLFLKQGHQSTGAVLKLALVYCLTIIAVLGASAIFLLSALRALSINPYMNFFLGGLFVVLALSLFGMYDLTLPNVLLRYSEKRRGAGGVIGTVFGAIAFSIVSFTCVAPFLGGFAGMTASGNYSRAELILAGIVFATAFASPFFVLALFPSLLKRLPKSGGWLDTVKAVMGFLELAAAFKFFRTAEIRLIGRPEYFTYDFSLGAWVAIAAVAGLYLLNLFRLPHDEEKPNVGVGRMMLGLAFLTLAVYLTPGLFRGPSGQSQRPGGVVYAWVSAFLLPDSAEGGGGALPWSADLKGTVEKIARAKRKGETPAKPLIFVDFTGVTCQNCKANEDNVFPRGQVKELLEQYTLVQMYTDHVPAYFYKNPPSLDDRKREAEYNLSFQKELFGTEQLPLYVILEPLTTGKVRVVGVYDEGKINDVPRFIEFLKAPLEKK